MDWTEFQCSHSKSEKEKERREGESDRGKEGEIGRGRGRRRERWRERKRGREGEIERARWRDLTHHVAVPFASDGRRHDHHCNFVQAVREAAPCKFTLITLSLPLPSLI